MKASISKKLCSLLILGQMGLWCAALPVDDATVIDDSNQETAGLVNPDQEQSMLVSDLSLESAISPVFLHSDGAENSAKGTSSGYSANPLPIDYDNDYLSNPHKYLGKNQFFYEIEFITDHYLFGAAILGLELFANEAILKHNEDNDTEWPCVFAGTFIAYDPGLKENGDNVVSLKKYGFKLKDLMHYLRTGGKIGWAGGLNSCFGVYGRFYFEHRRQYMRLQHEDKYGYSWTNSILPGIGVRFAPQFWRDDDEVNPYFEVGTTFTRILGCKSRYGDDKDQFGHGLTYTFGVGIRGNGQYRNSKIFVGLDLRNYDFFNRKWSNDGGFFFPYANIRDRKWDITVNITLPISFISIDD